MNVGIFFWFIQCLLIRLAAENVQLFFQKVLYFFRIEYEAKILFIYECSSVGKGAV